MVYSDPDRLPSEQRGLDGAQQRPARAAPGNTAWPGGCSACVLASHPAVSVPEHGQCMTRAPWWSGAGLAQARATHAPTLLRDRAAAHAHRRWPPPPLLHGTCSRHHTLETAVAPVEATALAEEARSEGSTRNLLQLRLRPRVYDICSCGAGGVSLHTRTHIGNESASPGSLSLRRTLSMRMSSGPSSRKLKPRCGSSSCLLLTPISANIRSATLHPVTDAQQ